MKRQNRHTIYAFIDSQNLNLGTGKSLYKNNKLIYRGWKLDFKKFALYLKNKFKVTKAFLFIGYIKKKQKLFKLIIPNRYSESRLLSRFQSYKIFLYRERNNLIYVNKNGRRRT